MKNIHHFYMPPENQQSENSIDCLSPISKKALFQKIGSSRQSSAAKRTPTKLNHFDLHPQQTQINSYCREYAIPSYTSISQQRRKPIHSGYLLEVNKAENSCHSSKETDHRKYQRVIGTSKNSSNHFGKLNGRTSRPKSLASKIKSLGEVSCIETVSENGDKENDEHNDSGYVYTPCLIKKKTQLSSKTPNPSTCTFTHEYKQQKFLKSGLSGCIEKDSAQSMSLKLGSKNNKGIKNLEKPLHIRKVSEQQQTSQIKYNLHYHSGLVNVQINQSFVHLCHQSNTSEPAAFEYRLSKVNVDESNIVFDYNGFMKQNQNDSIQKRNAIHLTPNHNPINHRLFSFFQPKNQDFMINLKRSQNKITNQDERYAAIVHEINSGRQTRNVQNPQPKSCYSSNLLTTTSNLPGNKESLIVDQGKGYFRLEKSTKGSLGNLNQVYRNTSNSLSGKNIRFVNGAIAPINVSTLKEKADGGTRKHQKLKLQKNNQLSPKQTVNVIKFDNKAVIDSPQKKANFFEEIKQEVNERTNNFFCKRANQKSKVTESEQYYQRTNRNSQTNNVTRSTGYRSREGSNSFEKRKTSRGIMVVSLQKSSRYEPTVKDEHKKKLQITSEKQACSNSRLNSKKDEANLARKRLRTVEEIKEGNKKLEATPINQKRNLHQGLKMHQPNKKLVLER